MDGIKGLEELRQLMINQQILFNEVYGYENEIVYLSDKSLVEIAIETEIKQRKELIESLERSKGKNEHRRKLCTGE